jgi:isopropylmalate/homocitrate/citramalate synthase
MGNQNILGTVFSLVHPNWDPNSHAGKEALTNYRQLLLMRVQAAAQKPTNLSKVSEVIQGPDESHAAFLERLLEAYRTYTPINPEAAENRREINIAFTSQSAPDIRKKLQKLEGFEGKLLSELVEIAQNVYNNRDMPEDRQKDFQR